MTNAEKFEEVFGIKIDVFPADPHGICDIADHQICFEASDCRHCQLHKFWEKPYLEEKKAKKEVKK